MGVCGVQAAFKECVRLAKDEPLPADRLLDAYFGLVRSSLAAGPVLLQVQSCCLLH